jgi:hypothetical protein
MNGNHSSHKRPYRTQRGVYDSGDEAAVNRLITELVTGPADIAILLGVRVSDQHLERFLGDHPKLNVVCIDDRHQTGSRVPDRVSGLAGDFNSESLWSKLECLGGRVKLIAFDYSTLKFADTLTWSVAGGEVWNCVKRLVLQGAHFWTEISTAGGRIVRPSELEAGPPPEEIDSGAIREMIFGGKVVGYSVRATNPLLQPYDIIDNGRYLYSEYIDTMRMLVETPDSGDPPLQFRHRRVSRDDYPLVHPHMPERIDAIDISGGRAVPHSPLADEIGTIYDGANQ